MNISAINNTQSFGKTALMHCKVRTLEDKERIGATLYKMDPKNNNDVKDVKFSKTAYALIKDMSRDSRKVHPTREYYILTNDKTGEVISCAQTSNHFRADEGKVSGSYMLLEEVNSNDKYINPIAPMIAFLADKAFNHFDSGIVIGTSELDDKTLKRAKFSRAQNGDWFIPQKRFIDFTDKATKKYDMVI